MRGTAKVHLKHIRRSAVVTLPGKDNVPDDLAVDSTRDAVLQLQVHLGDSVLGEDGSIGDITWNNELAVYSYLAMEDFQSSLFQSVAATGRNCGLRDQTEKSNL